MRNTTLLLFASVTLLVACSCKSQTSTASKHKSRPSVEQPTTDQPTGEQPTAEQPTGEMPPGEQPIAEAPSGEQPTAEVPAPDAAAPDQPTPEKAPGEDATAEKPPGDAAAPDAAAPDAAAPDKPPGDQPTADATEKPAPDQPAPEQPAPDQPVTEKPAAPEQPAPERPAPEPPVAEKPAARETAFGSIERLDPGLDALIAPDAKIEKLADGLDWSEGPLWQRQGGYLLFSDVPKNVILKWDPNDGKVSEFMKPSGYTGAAARGGEPGSNGLTFDAQGRLVICQHGDRRIVRVESDGKWTTLADKFDGKRLNSPNDLCFDRKGNLYFTDPSYGLEGKNDDPKKELPHNGVYLLRKDGKLLLLTKGMSFPNGIALSPDEKTLYVNQSDPSKPIIRAFGVKDDGTLANARILFDASNLTQGRKGLPDGLKVDEKGNIFSSGPGGILVISPEGKHLGTINTGQSTANCAWGDDGSTLYITADMFLCRVKTLTKGKMP